MPPSHSLDMRRQAVVLAKRKSVKAAAKWAKVTEQTVRNWMGAAMPDRKVKKSPKVFSAIALLRHAKAAMPHTSKLDQAHILSMLALTELERGGEDCL